MSVLRQGGGTVRGNSGCPEDSVASDNGGCKCVSPCPKLPCQPGMQPVKVRDAEPEKPGSCCPLYECRDQETVSWLVPEEQTSQQQHCADSSGQPREFGERWQEEDPCITCTCELAGAVHCQTAMCRSCPNPMPRVPGECCSRCPDLQPPFATTTGCNRTTLKDCRVECENGLDRDATGCEICRCRSSLQNEVDTRAGCPRSECGLRCEYGLLVDENECDICQCRLRPGCPTRLACPVKCPQGYANDERGCSSCRCAGSCLDENNTTRPEGSTWISNPCSSCVCELNGRILCNQTICSVGCFEPRPPPPGHCCPVCPFVSDESRGWGTAPTVLIVVLALLCVLMMVHLARTRFRGRLSVPGCPDHQPEFSAGFSHQHHQYYKCLPVGLSETHVPEKLPPI
ncbi:hypothetical protein QAD02_014582 [Eretmocerus hayati]|uniref:Uncharacterized protein n=1 Tax=Eretmocerus hayati TaxID=131215 RepID=A0ACC2PAM2_9HYME|nr:hypothetical protein QAD02_014582 [Eretmocerus hayati]